MQKKILIVAPAWVGDMVMGQSLFKLLKLRRPEVLIDVLAPASTLPLLARMPEISVAISSPFTHGQLNLTARYELGRQLRTKHYDQAILLPNSLKSALIPWFAKIPLRTGWRGEMRWLILNDLRYLDKKRYPLMIERFMALALAPEEELPETYPWPKLQEDVSAQQAVLAKHQMKISEQKILALCPGAEFGPAKRWPETYYAAVAKQKLTEGWTVWLLGAPKDAPAAEQIMALTARRCVNLVGQTSLLEAVDLLSLATVVVSNDSGLMHIAAAVGKPLIVVYGATSSSFTPPLHPQAKTLTLSLPCQPCFKRECPLIHHRCMQDLHPQLVLDAIGAMV